MGASSGIGEATTKKLAHEGAKLVISARRDDRLKALVESLPNDEISYAVGDVTNKEEVQAVVDLAMEKYCRVDVLYNNAGIMPTAPLSEKRYDEWRQMLDLNIMGVLNGIAAVLPIRRSSNLVKLLRLTLLQDMLYILVLLYTVVQNLLYEPSWKDYVKKNVKTIFVQLLYPQD
jgi:NADP-dependent 3-hydroxy acid dehydrogenase YdfG